jgi:hypothetical protein
LLRPRKWRAGRPRPAHLCHPDRINSIRESEWICGVEGPCVSSDPNHRLPKVHFAQLIAESQPWLSIHPPPTTTSPS